MSAQCQVCFTFFFKKFFALRDVFHRQRSIGKVGGKPSQSPAATAPSSEGVREGEVRRCAGRHCRGGVRLPLFIAGREPCARPLRDDLIGVVGWREDLDRSHRLFPTGNFEDCICVRLEKPSQSPAATALPEGEPRVKGEPMVKRAAGGKSRGRRFRRLFFKPKKACLFPRRALFRVILLK